MTRRGCPTCGGRTIRIVYGLPSFETAQAARHGEVHIGGCCVLTDSPRRWCPRCDSAVPVAASVNDEPRDRDAEPG